MRRSRRFTVLDDKILSPSALLAGNGGSSAEPQDKTQQTAATRIDLELQMAGALQRNLHSPPPSGNGVCFHALYRPAGAVSGDSYDVVRLGPKHVSIALADATGHDLSAAMLSVFVKRSMHGKEVTPSGSRMLDPDEVLARTNTDLVDARLTECQFVTALYALYDETTRVLRWARAGAPHPILLRRGRPPQRLMSSGPLLGVLPRPTFEVVQLLLEPGDTVLFHTDGLEAFLAERPGVICPLGGSCADWISGLPHAPAEQILAEFQDALDTARVTAAQCDDVTVVSLAVDPPRAAPHPRKWEDTSPMSVPAADVVHPWLEPTRTGPPSLPTM